MILYSILVHECPECVKQMSDGIMFYDRNAIVVIHVSDSQSLETFKVNDRIIINPTQYATRWGWDFAKIHVSNYLHVKDNFNFDISYIIFLTSNCLMTKNPIEYIKNYDCGFSEYDPSGIKFTPPLLHKEYHMNWGGSFIKSEKYLDILSEIGSNKKYGCIIDGAYVTSHIMDKICYFYNKHFKEDPEYLKYINAPEEIIFPTIACNLSNNISESLLFFYKFMDLNVFKRSLNNEKTFFSKEVPRDMSNEIRIYYNNLIY